VLFERIRALEMCGGRSEGLCVRRVGYKPFGINVKHEKIAPFASRSAGSCSFPRVDRDDGVLDELPPLVANVDLRRRSTDMKDQVSLAVRMHIEGTSTE